MDKKEIYEIIKKTILAFESKDIEVFNDHLHIDFKLDYEGGYYGGGWDPKLIQSMDKEVFIDYVKGTLVWQDYKINHYDILIEDNQAMCFINADLEIQKYYHKILDTEIPQYGPVKYNWSTHYMFSEGKIITTNIIQDTDTIRIAIGNLISKEKDTVKIRKYLEVLRNQKIIG